MATALSGFYSLAMQAGMRVLVTMDRLWGNLIVDIDGDSSPHPVIRALRTRGTVLRSYMVNGWVVISHDDVKTLLRDPRLSSEVFDNRLIQTIIRSAARGLVVPIIDYPNMVNLDAPDHTRIRKLSAKSFTNRFVQSLTPKIDGIVTDLLNQVDNASGFDVMDVLAKPLPAIVIAEMLGVPVKDRHLFEKWSAELLGYTDVLNADRIHEAVAGDLSIRGYLQDLVQQKRLKPGDDLISAMIAVEEAGDQLDLDELLSTCTILLVAGHETTTRLIGSCLQLLMEHPDQFAEVRQDRQLLRRAIDEALRLEPPVLALSRVVTESFEFQGCEFRKGQVVLLSIAGANRDPAVTDDPDAFNIHREAIEHVSFGHGIHLCLGMPLARLEAEQALGQLFDRFDEIEAVSEMPEWESSPFFRGLKQLPVRVSHASPAR